MKKEKWLMGPLSTIKPPKESSNAVIYFALGFAFGVVIASFFLGAK